MKQLKKEGLARLALFSAALIWGSSFFIVKNTAEFFPTNLLLGVRFLTGFLILGAIFFRRLKNIRRVHILGGTAAGLCLYVAYAVQTLGVTLTTPGKNAFLTSVYCVLVPFLFWVFYKKKPDIFNIAAAALCLVGIGLISVDSQLKIGTGDILTLISGLFFALHIVIIAGICSKHDPFLITIIQFAAAAAVSFAVGFSSESFPAALPSGALAGIAYLAVVCTTGALLLQNLGQSNASPSAASIIMSLEAVFGVAFSMVFYGERLTVRLAAGFLAVFASVVISETKLNFLLKGKGQKT